MNINLTQQLRYTDYYKFLGLEVVDTLGDGNCLFRAVSVLLYGSEEHHAQLREVCVKQMVLVTFITTIVTTTTTTQTHTDWTFLLC